MSFHSGYACILGRPNAGKSTLLNALVGEKIAIISPKPQTTRNRILGIINVPEKKGHQAGQIVLIDTPGVHRPDSSLGRKMMSDVQEALHGCQLILLIVDAKRKWAEEDAFALDLVKRSGTPVFLLLNKIDLLPDKRDLLPLITAVRSEDFAERPPLFSRGSNHGSAASVHGGRIDPRACFVSDSRRSAARGLGNGRSI
jgi:GTP-binding protein Era